MDEAFDFSQLSAIQDDVDDMPKLHPYAARDTVKLHYRHYPSDSRIHVILVHGSSGHSGDLHLFASHISTENIANVYTPDLRGHGPKPQRRGDIEYIGQLEDDIADLINHIKSTIEGEIQIVVGGHSSGGGMALRFGGSEHGQLAHAYLLLAPYFAHDAPMVKNESSGWS